MSYIAKKIVKAAKQAPDKFRQYLGCRHEWVAVWVTRTHEAAKCVKCRTVRVQVKGTP